MAATLHIIADNQDRYSCQVEKLGEQKIVSPVRHHEFVRDGERVIATESLELVEALAKKLGHMPSFEKAGPHAKIFHDPSWTRAGIVTAGA